MGTDSPWDVGTGSGPDFDATRKHAANPRAARELAARARDARLEARRHLLGLQASDGSWCGELEGDTILESEYFLTMWFLGRGEDPKLAKAAAHLRARQQETGGWAIHAGGVDEVSASTKADFVLLLAGDDPEAAHMQRARGVIRSLGGLEACNTYTKIYLAIFGQVAWRECPAIPPSVMLFPRWFPFNIYAMSAWSRGIVVPLCIIWATKPRLEVPARADLSHLRVAREDLPPELVKQRGVTRFTGRRTLWTWLFGLSDRLLKLSDRLHLRPLQGLGMRRALRFTLEHLEQSDGLGAIFPPIINTIFALRCLGYAPDDPVLAGQIAELERLEIEEDETLRVQPCFSVVWDTAQSGNALLAAGLGSDAAALARASDWLVAHEVRQPGDWSLRLPEVEPGGWYFEYANEFYPDCDDTAEVLAFLARVQLDDPEAAARREAALRRGAAWQLAMQNDDGGWAAFDRGCDRQFLSYVPFADHNAMLDPSCEDITGRTLVALAALGFARQHDAVDRGVEYLYRRQEPDGTWYGRWGCNYLYGTWLAMTGLVAAGEDPADPRIQRAADWLVSVQQADGSFGETLASYDDPSLKGCGESTAAQTAWALLALMATGHAATEPVQRGIRWLLRSQRADGSWQDTAWTGTGFPRVFYLQYHLYAVQFPLAALGTYLTHVGPSENAGTPRPDALDDLRSVTS